MDIRLPSRYEDLDKEYRSKLRPVPELNRLIQSAFASMKVSGGIRFLPIFGKSGCGKTCAACELSTHIPSSHLELLSDEHLALPTSDLTDHLCRRIDLFNQQDLFLWVIDQYEEKVRSAEDIPTEFIEKLSLLDRGPLRSQPMVFLWLTTDRSFQRALTAATSRNTRILLQSDFELTGIPREEWPQVIDETFSFHNGGKALADFGMLRNETAAICRDVATIGDAVEETGKQIGEPLYRLQDLSKLQIILVWPVADGTGIERVKSFANPSSGYTLNWSAWHNRLSASDRNQLPLAAYNRARLYFDLRVVPIPVADLHSICKQLDNDDYVPAPSYLEQFKKTRYYSILSGHSEERSFGSLFSRDSKRAREGREWYEESRTHSVAVGKRIAKCLSELGFPSQHEKEVRSPAGRVVPDVLSSRKGMHQSEAITELKLFAPANTTPAAIRDEIRRTLRKYAMLAGYIPRQ